MPITIFIEIAIGIVFVWLFLALAVMAVQEWWDALLKTRAKNMQKILRGMLENPAQLQEIISDKSIVMELYRHPQIQSLCQPITSNRLLGKLSRRQAANGRVQRAFKVTTGDTTSWRWLPSYIPTKTFALALYDVITTAGSKDSLIQGALNEWQNMVDASIASLQQNGTLRSKPEQQENETDTDFEARNAEYDRFVAALSGALDTLKQVAQEKLSQSDMAVRLNATVAQIKANTPEIEPALTALKPMIHELPQYLLSQDLVKGISNLAANNLAAKEMLEDLQNKAISAATQGEKAIAAFRTNVETWFDNTMARAGGWYKRRAQRFAIICGFLIAVFLNVDSLAIVSALYKEPTLRAAVVAEAGTTVQGEVSAQGAKPKEVSEKLQELGLPVGWRFAEQETCTEIDELGNRSLDIGATRCVFPADKPRGIAVENVRQGIVFWFLKILGWGFSGAMAMQGAPFWFDILKRLVNVRSAGQKPEEVEEKKK